MPPKPAPEGGFFKKFADSIKEQKDEDLKTSVKRFEETLTEIRELDSVKKAKEIYSKAKVACPVLQRSIGGRRMR